MEAVKWILLILITIPMLIYVFGKGYYSNKVPEYKTPKRNF